MIRRLLVLAAALILTAGVFPKTIVAQGLPPHKDPSAEQSEFSAISLLSYFGIILELLGSRDYVNVADLLEQLRHANLPEDLRFIVDRYAELVGGLRNELESAESSLGRASALLDRGDRPAAQRELETAGRSLLEARRLLQDLQPATDALGRRFGAFGAKAGIRLSEAYDQLRALLIRLDDLWARYAETLTQLEAALERPEASDIPAPTVEPPVAGPTPIPRVELLLVAEPTPVATTEVPIAGAAPVGDTPDTEPAGGRFNDRVKLVILSVAAAYMAGALTVAWVRRLKRGAHILADNRTVPRPGLSSLSATGSPMPLPNWAYIDPGTSRGRVVSAYHHAAQFLASGLALAYQPYFTLRDFLLAIGSRMTTAFNDLTSEAERALYASDATDDESALRAEALADSVREEGA